VYCCAADAVLPTGECASRMIEGDKGENKVVRDTGKIRQLSHANSDATPKRAGVW
jgi:hypothetical protein